MFGRKKQKIEPIRYDPETEYPVIRASICNGEQVAGIKNRKSGVFTEVALIQSDKDLEIFKKRCSVDEVKKEY